jgi:hypothetical protein
MKRIFPNQSVLTGVEQLGKWSSSTPPDMDCQNKLRFIFMSHSDYEFVRGKRKRENIGLLGGIVSLLGADYFCGFSFAIGFGIGRGLRGTFLGGFRFPTCRETRRSMEDGSFS